MTLNEEISNLNKQLLKEKSTVSSLLEEKKKLKSDFKLREDELLDKQIQLENNIKELDNILVKTGQSIQTMHMLSPKPDSFYHTEQKMALGYQNPFYLKQAQQKQQSLYNGKVLLEKHDPPAVYDSEETLQLAQESRLKMKQLNKEIKPANYTKINHLLGVFVSQTAKSREELYFSNTSKMANVSKPISIPNEEFSDDTTPSVARKFLNECEECKYDKISYDKAYNDMQQKIKRLQAQLGDQKGKSKDTPCVSNTLDPLSQKLENENVELEFQVRNYEKENAHLKTTYKNLFDSISVSEQEDTTKVTSNSVPTPQESKVVKNDNVIAPGMFRINPLKTSREDKFVPINKVKASVRTNPITVSQPHVITKKDVNSDSNGLSSTGVDNTTKTRRLQPRSNTKNDKVASDSKSSCIKNKEVEVEEHPRNLLLSKNKKHMSSECNNVKLAIRNDKYEVVCAKADVSNTEKQKKQKPKVMKPKKVGSNKRLASPKPSKPRPLPRWSPTGRLFDLKGKIIASSESENQSNCSKGDNLRILAKHKTLELEIERLLRAVVSQDIMSIVQNPSVVDSSNLQTELDRTKERLENCIIKKENEYAKLWNDWYKKCEECKYDKISYDKAYNDMQQKIERLQAQLGDQKGKSKDTPCVSNTLDPLSQKLENENVELEFQVRNYEKEIAHLKTTYKNLFDSISVTRAQTKSIIDSLQNKLQDTIYENAKLRAQLFDKVSDQKDTNKGTSANTKFAKQSILGKPPSSSRPKLYVVTPLPNSTAFPKVGETNALSKPVTSNSVPSSRESNVVKNERVIAPGIFRINPFKATRVDNFVPNKHVKTSVRTKPIIVSQPHVITKNDVNSKTNGFSPKDSRSTTRTRRPKPWNNPKSVKVPFKSNSGCLSNKLEKIEENHRSLQSSHYPNHTSSECNNIKLAIRNEKSEVICATCKQCLITANHDDCVLQYVNGMKSRKKNQSANVSKSANQKKHKAQVWKPKNVGSKERFASPKPSKPRSCLRWSPTGRFFDLKGKIIASSESESQSDCSKGDNACTSNPQEPIKRRSPSLTFSMKGC
ncbi:hypothetical protein Tco_0143911 [Tanacetum coccineum]